MSSALELREANGIVYIPGFPDRRAPAFVELITAWKALQDRKDAHEEIEVVVWWEHGMLCYECVH